MKQEQKLPSQAFTICKENSYSKEFSGKIYRTEKAAQKAADKKQDGWKVLPLFVGYESYEPDNPVTSVSHAHEVCSAIIKHLSDPSIKVDTLKADIDREYNVIRYASWEDGPVKRVKGDSSIVVDFHIKYKVDV